MNNTKTSSGAVAPKPKRCGRYNPGIWRARFKQNVDVVNVDALKHVDPTDAEGEP